MYIYLYKEFGLWLLKFGNFDLSIILLSIQNETIQEEAFASSCLMVVTPMCESHSVSLKPSLYISVTNSTVSGGTYVTAFKSRDKQGIRVSYNSEDGLIKVGI